MTDRVRYLPIHFSLEDIKCLSKGCGKQATTEFLANGLGSFHCDDCIAIFKKYHPQTD